MKIEAINSVAQITFEKPRVKVHCIYAEEYLIALKIIPVDLNIRGLRFISRLDLSSLYARNRKSLERYFDITSSLSSMTEKLANRIATLLRRDSFSTLDLLNEVKDYTLPTDEELRTLELLIEKEIEANEEMESNENCINRMLT